MMRFYNQQHRFYCGIDLHARTLAVCILDAAGAIAFRGNVAASPKAVLDALAPFREGVAVACECMFAWYRLADLCEDHAIPFVLGLAPSMKMIHGGPRPTATSSDDGTALLTRHSNSAVEVWRAPPRGELATTPCARAKLWQDWSWTQAAACAPSTSGRGRHANKPPRHFLCFCLASYSLMYFSGRPP
jgi:hypothetical protein